MSMSNHERNQFELLTKMFASDDPALARQIAKRAKASEMTRFAPEDVKLVAYFGLAISLLVVFSIFFIPSNGWNLVCSFLLSLFCMNLILRYGGTQADTREREYSDG
jgi:hypothetical protein